MTKILTRAFLGLLAIAIGVYLLMPVLVIIPMSWSDSIIEPQKSISYLKLL